MKVVAIIQARMGATRLPNKMMLHLHGYPICEWVFRRVSSAKHIDNVVFALPDTSQDDLLEKFLNSIGPAIKNARRSLVALKNIPKGQLFWKSASDDIRYFKDVYHLGKEINNVAYQYLKKKGLNYD